MRVFVIIILNLYLSYGASAQCDRVIELQTQASALADTFLKGCGTLENSVNAENGFENFSKLTHNEICDCVQKNPLANNIAKEGQRDSKRELPFAYAQEFVNQFDITYTNILGQAAELENNYKFSYQVDKNKISTCEPAKVLSILDKNDACKGRDKKKNIRMLKAAFQGQFGDGPNKVNWQNNMKDKFLNEYARGFINYADAGELFNRNTVNRHLSGDGDYKPKACMSNIDAQKFTLDWNKEDNQKVAQLFKENKQIILDAYQEYNGLSEQEKKDAGSLVEHLTFSLRMQSSDIEKITVFKDNSDYFKQFFKNSKTLEAYLNVIEKGGEEDYNIIQTQFSKKENLTPEMLALKNQLENNVAETCQNLQKSLETFACSSLDRKMDPEKDFEDVKNLLLNAKPHSEKSRSNVYGLALEYCNNVDKNERDPNDAQAFELLRQITPSDLKGQLIPVAMRMQDQLIDSLNSQSKEQVSPCSLIKAFFGEDDPMKFQYLSFTDFHARWKQICPGNKPAEKLNFPDKFCQNNFKDAVSIFNYIKLEQLGMDINGEKNGGVDTTALLERDLERLQNSAFFTGNKNARTFASIEENLQKGFRKQTLTGNDNSIVDKDKFNNYLRTNSNGANLNTNSVVTSNSNSAVNSIKKEQTAPTTANTKVNSSYSYDPSKNTTFTPDMVHSVDQINGPFDNAFKEAQKNILESNLEDKLARNSELEELKTALSGAQSRLATAEEELRRAREAKLQDEIISKEQELLSAKAESNQIISELNQKLNDAMASKSKVAANNNSPINEFGNSPAGPSSNQGQASAKAEAEAKLNANATSLSSNNATGPGIASGAGSVVINNGVAATGNNSFEGERTNRSQKAYDNLKAKGVEIDYGNSTSNDELVIIFKTTSGEKLGEATFLVDNKTKTLKEAKVSGSSPALVEAVKTYQSTYNASNIESEVIVETKKEVQADRKPASVPAPATRRGPGLSDLNQVIEKTNN